MDSVMKTVRDFITGLTGVLASVIGLGIVAAIVFGGEAYGSIPKYRNDAWQLQWPQCSSSSVRLGAPRARSIPAWTGFCDLRSGISALFFMLLILVTARSVVRRWG